MRASTSRAPRALPKRACDVQRARSYSRSIIYYPVVWHKAVDCWLCAADLIGESIPPTSDGLLKFLIQAQFHKQGEAQTNLARSSPWFHLASAQSTWSHDVPEGLQKEVRTVMKHVYSKEVERLEIENYRICWYAGLFICYCRPFILFWSLLPVFLIHG